MDPSPRLKSKTAVITGASTGIGRAIARLFGKQGARIIINYQRSHKAAQQLVAEINAEGGHARAFQADISRPEGIDGLVNAALEAFGRIDIWANIAGADILTGNGARLSDLEKLNRLLLARCSADERSRRGGDSQYVVGFGSAGHGGA
jgi:NAD(P)-dependent dehydrogenase (short-subunit alcohol dehydrogenase family)